MTSDALQLNKRLGALVPRGVAVRAQLVHARHQRVEPPQQLLAVAVALLQRSAGLPRQQRPLHHGSA